MYGWITGAGGGGGERGRGVATEVGGGGPGGGGGGGQNVSSFATSITDGVPREPGWCHLPGVSSCIMDKVRVA